MAGAWTSRSQERRTVSSSHIPRVTSIARHIHTFADSLHGAHFGAIFHAVNGEVNLGERLLLLYCADGIVDLDVAKILGPRRTSAVGIHLGRR